MLKATLLLTNVLLILARPCVFLTGGSGYLGRNIIREYVKKGYEVHAIARSESALKVVRDAGAIAFEGDLQSVEAMTKAAIGCNMMIHSAASVASFGKLEDSIKANVDGTANAMIAAKIAKVKKAVHVGTEAGCVNENGDPLVNVDESTPLPEKPFNTIYSTTKNLAEKKALSFNDKDFAVVAVRPRFIWGNDDTVILPQLVEAATSGVLQWFDGGEYKTSTCHVLNVVRGIELALEKGKPGSSYFLTDGPAITWKDFVSQSLIAVDVKPPTNSIPSKLIWVVAHVAEFFCNIFQCEPLIDRQKLVLTSQEMTVNDALARRELGYSNVITMEEGMKDLRERYLREKKIKKDKIEL